MSRITLSLSVLSFIAATVLDDNGSTGKLLDVGRASLSTRTQWLSLSDVFAIVDHEQLLARSESASVAESAV